MDSDFWTSRLAAAKRQYTLGHHHQSSHLGIWSISLSLVFDFSFLVFINFLSWIYGCLCFWVRSVEHRWFWGRGRGPTRFPLPVLLRGLRHRVALFASRRRALVRVQSHRTYFFGYTHRFVFSSFFHMFYMTNYASFYSISSMRERMILLSGSGWRVKISVDVVCHPPLFFPFIFLSSLACWYFLPFV